MRLRRRSLLQLTAGVTAIGAWPVRGAWADVPGVTLSGSETTLTTSDIDKLKGRLRGELLKAGDASYDTTRKLWSGSFDRHPALIARCAGADDIIAAVNFARSRDLVVAVRAGGHSYSGQSSCDGGLMIDLQPMKTVAVDPNKRVARVGAGVLLGEFDKACQAHGLATTAGVIPHTGVAGLTLGGGVGRLMRMYGMSIDNVLSIDMVTADGRFVRASADENPELFWGVRGGAGNFGIVTSFDFRLHPVGPMVQTFAYSYPKEQARQALKFFFEFTDQAPDNIHTIGGIRAGEDGTVSAYITGTHFGTPAEAERQLAPVAKFGKPSSGRVQTVSYLDVQSAGPNPAPAGRGNYSTGGYTGHQPAIVDPAVDSYEHTPFPDASTSFFALGGAASRVANDATAYAHRAALCQVAIGGTWEDPLGAGKEHGDKLMEWSRKAWATLVPFSDGGFYANQTTDISERAIRENYRDNYDRLVALKTQYDPTNFFRRNANIHPKA